MVFKETSTLINSIFSLNENSWNVNIFFDVDCPSLYVIVYFDVKSGLLNQLLDFVQGEKVSHRSVLPNVVAVADLSSAFEPENKKKQFGILELQDLRVNAKLLVVNKLKCNGNQERRTLKRLTWAWFGILFQFCICT